MEKKSNYKKRGVQTYFFDICLISICHLLLTKNVYRSLSFNMITVHLYDFDTGNMLIKKHFFFYV